MPKVETYQPQVAEAPLQLPLQRLDTGGGNAALARGAANLTYDLSRLHAQLQEEDDAAVVKERINKYRTQSLSTLEEYRGVMGRDAYDTRGKVESSLQEYAKELGGDLTGRQQQLFDSAVQDYILRDKATIGDHSFQQRTTWLNGQDEALVALAQEDYVANPNSHANPQEHHDRIVASDARYGELGQNARPDGKTSTEISVTVESEELGGWANVPLLVKGQVGVEALLSGEKPTPQQEQIAVRRAKERVAKGATLPSYGSVEEAVKAAESRTEEEKVRPYRPGSIYEQQIRGAAANLANRNGWAPEKQQLYVDEKISEANVAIVNQYLDSSPAQAASFYANNKDKILPSMRAPLEKQIVEEGKYVRVQNAVEALFSEYADSPQFGRDSIRENYSGKERNEMLSAYNARVAEYERAKQDNQEKSYRGALGIIWGDGQNPGMGIEGISYEMRESLRTAGTWDDIIEEDKAFRTGVQREDDSVWLMDSYNVLSPEDKKRVPVALLKKHTNIDTFNSIMDEREKGLSTFTRDEGVLMNAQLRLLGIKTGETATEQDEARTKQYWDRVTGDYKEFQRAYGRDPYPEEKNDMILKATAKEDLLAEGGWWVSLESGGAFEIDTPENLQLLAEEFEAPPEAIKETLEYLRDSGREVNKSNMRTALKAWTP